MPVPVLYDRNQVAEICHAPTRTVDHWYYSGKLKGRKVGRRVLFAEVDVLRFIGGSTGEAVDEAAAPKRASAAR